MANFLTKRQVVTDFKRDYVPHITEDLYSKAWGLLLGELLKENKISLNQYSSWTLPSIVTKTIKE